MFRKYLVLVALALGPLVLWTASANAQQIDLTPSFHPPLLLNDTPIGFTSAEPVSTQPSTWGKVKVELRETEVSTPDLAYPGFCFTLNVPWMSQVPPGVGNPTLDWQRTNNCGQAICVMLGGYFNGGTVASWVITAENNWMGCPTPYGCQTGAATLQNLLSGFHGLRSESRVGIQPDDVVTEGSRGRPVIVGVRTGMEETGGRPHWMLFVGWDGSSMYFHDPGRSSYSNGAFVRYSRDQFYLSWNNQGRRYIPVYR